MKCMNVKGLEAYQVKKFLKKLEESLRNKDWSEMRTFGREKREVSRERSSEMSYGSYRELKVLAINLDRCRCQEVSRYLSRTVSRKRSSTAEVSRRCWGTTQQNQEQKLDRSTRCQKAIEDADPFSIDPPGIKKLSGLR